MRPKDYQTFKSELTREEYLYLLYDDLVCASKRLAEVMKDVERFNELVEALKKEVFSEAEK